MLQRELILSQNIIKNPNVFARVNENMLSTKTEEYHYVRQTGGEQHPQETSNMRHTLIMPKDLRAKTVLSPTHGGMHQRAISVLQRSRASDLKQPSTLIGDSSKTLEPNNVMEDKRLKPFKPRIDFVPALKHHSLFQRTEAMSHRRNDASRFVSPSKQTGDSLMLEMTASSVENPRKTPY